MAMTDDTPIHLRGNGAPVFEERTLTNLTITGKLPAELDGRYLRNGANPITGMSEHPFFGDGMVHGIRLRDGRYLNDRLSTYLIPTSLDAPRIHALFVEALRSVEQMDAACTRFAQRVPLIDARFFVTAVLTQREAGGNLAEVVDNTAFTIRERAKLQREVRVLTAQSRFSAMLLTGLPMSAWPAVSPMYSSARARPRAAAGSLSFAGSGTTPLIGSPIPGFVP